MVIFDGTKDERRGPDFIAVLQVDNQMMYQLGKNEMASQKDQVRLRPLSKRENDILCFQITRLKLLTFANELKPYSEPITVDNEKLQVFGATMMHIW